MLIALEGLDQSGKETQAKFLRDRLRGTGLKARVVSFPDYGTSIGEEIARALQGERDYGPEVMQLLYVANRYERRPDIERWQQAGHRVGVRPLHRLEHRVRGGGGIGRDVARRPSAFPTAA